MTRLSYPSLPDMPVLVADLLEFSASKSPDKVALVCGEREVTFAELRALARGVAHTLLGIGLRRGDRVMVMLDNSIEMAAAVFGSAMAGAAFVPVSPSVRSTKLAYLLGDCAPRVLIAARSKASVLRTAMRGAADGLAGILWVDGVPEAAVTDGVERPFSAAAAPGANSILPRLIDQDLAAIIYTSGSTGEPKGVMMTHRNITNAARSITSYLGNRPDDVVLCVLPLSYTYGLHQLFAAAAVGFTLILERTFAYPAHVLARMAERRITGLPGVPTMFASLLQLAPYHGLDLSCLRYMTNAAAALPPVHVLGLRQAFPGVKLFSMYGLTECARATWLDPARADDKVGSVGKAIPNSEVYLVDDADRRLPLGSEGELVVRSASVMRGYWNKPAETALKLREGDIPGEAVLHTGDLFCSDEEGFLYFLGRCDDIFMCRGLKVCPSEIEHVLCEYPGVAEAAVVPVPHPSDGMAVKAVVVPAPGAPLDKAALRAHCRARLESHQMPRIIEQRAALPRSDNGKVEKRLLSEIGPQPC